MNSLKRTKKWVKAALVDVKDRVVFMAVVVLVASILCIGVLAAIISSPFIVTVSAMICLLTYLVNNE